MLSQNGNMDGNEQYSKPSTEGDPIIAAHASFFLLPSGGVKRERERKQKNKQESKDKHKLITHIIQASMAKPWVYSQVCYLQSRALCTRSASALQFLRLSLMLVVSSAYKTLLSKSAAE